VSGSSRGQSRYCTVLAVLGVDVGHPTGNHIITPQPCRLAPAGPCGQTQLDQLQVVACQRGQQATNFLMGEIPHRPVYLFDLFQPLERVLIVVVPQCDQHGKNTAQPVLLPVERTGLQPACRRCARYSANNRRFICRAWG